MSEPSRFSVFTQHEISILMEVLKEPHPTLIFVDSQLVMDGQNNPCESTRKSLLKEIKEA